jgi:hypothetical protein
MITKEQRELVIKAITNHPDLSFTQIGSMLGVSASFVCTTGQAAGIPSRGRGTASSAWQKKAKPKPEQAAAKAGTDGQ